MSSQRVHTIPSWRDREHIIYVSDESGSMRQRFRESTRFEAARAALAELIQSASESLDPASTVSVIQFSSSASVVCPGHQLDTCGVGKLLAAVAATKCGEGCTNITSALQMACSLLQHGIEGTPRIVLLTDGKHNDGPHPHSGGSFPWGIGPDGPQMPRGIHVTTIGIGNKDKKEVDETLLTWLASRLPTGGKDYHYITNDRALLVLCRQLGRGLVLGR